MKKCRLCTKSYRTAAGLAKHVRVSHAVNSVVYKCSKCHYSSNYKKNINSHISYHIKRNDQLHKSNWNDLICVVEYILSKK